MISRRVESFEIPMKAVAIKKGQLQEQPPMPEPRGRRAPFIVTAAEEEFIIYHDAPFTDKTVAESQAHRLAGVLADEHERERKHPDRIQLPE
jgi:hypothetical protein